MPDTIGRSPVMPGRFHSYVIGGNACNAFAIGEVGSDEEFFLIGAEARDESSYPLLTGSFLDPEGKFLFRLVRNVLESNPRDCKKTVGERIGYEIHDSAGALILKVSTEYARLAGATTGSFVTTVSANAYDKSGRLVLKVASGGADEKIESGVKGVFGISGFGALGKVTGMSEMESDVAKAVLQSGGANHRVLTGPISGQTIELDRVALCDAQLSNCTINVRSANVSFIGTKTAFHNCEINFFDGAGVLKNLIAHVLREGKQGQSG